MAAGTADSEKKALLRGRTAVVRSLLCRCLEVVLVRNKDTGSLDEHLLGWRMGRRGVVGAFNPHLRTVDMEKGFCCCELTTCTGLLFSFDTESTATKSDSEFVI